MTEILSTVTLNKQNFLLLSFNILEFALQSNHLRLFSFLIVLHEIDVLNVEFSVFVSVHF